MRDDSPHPTIDAMCRGQRLPARRVNRCKAIQMKSLLAAAALALLSLAPAHSAQFERPSGDVVLTVTGLIGNTNAGATAQFDLAMLEGLKGRSASMETPWTEGTTEFAGPYLKAILEAVGATGGKLVVKALNDYSAEVPMEDAVGYDTILATRMNGQPMSVRDKGPLFMIYPFDKNPELYSEKYFSRSVWQIKEIEVVE
jgi:hypothetical protein